MWWPTGTITEHWRTLVSQNDGKPARRARTSLILAPLCAGAATLIWVPDTPGVILDGTAIVTALLFGLLVHVFGLGLTVTNDPRMRNSWVVELIDQLRVNVAYAILVGVLAALALMIAAAYQSYDSATRVAGAIGVALVVHLFMTLGMVLKRTNTAYSQMRKLSREHLPN